MPNPLSRWSQRFQEKVPWPRSLAPAILFTLLAFGLAWSIERSGLSVQLTRELGRRSPSLMMEPALVWQVYIFLQTFALKAVISLLLVVYLALTGASVPEALGLRKPGNLSPRAHGLFLLFSVMIGVASGLDPLTPAFPMHSFFEDALIWGNVIAVISMLVVAPLAEEVFFRGFIYPALNRAVGPWFALIGVSVLFAAAHWRPEVEFSSLAIVFAGSIGITLARMVTGSTWSSIRLHAIYNATLLLMGALRYALWGY